MSQNNTPQMTLEAIRSVPLFASLDDNAATLFVSLFEVQEVSANTKLFDTGDKGNAMYLIERGRVRISVRDKDNQEITLAELARGDFFGEMSIIDGKRRSADATVTDDARFAILSRDNFMTFIQSNPIVTLEMLSAVFERLRRTDELLQQRVSRNANEEEKKRMTLSDRMADMLAEFGGSWKFIGVSLALIIGWIIFNSIILVRGFDPAPYQMLNLTLAVVAGLQAPIIMMSQNRQSEKDRLRADLDYKVNLKNELALTEILRRLHVLERDCLDMTAARSEEQMARRGAADELDDLDL